MELMVVIGIIAVLLVAVLPAINSVSKSGGRKAAVGNLLGAIEQARVLAIKGGHPTYIVFPAQLPSGGDPANSERYAYRSFAIFEDDLETAGTTKQVTPWKTLPTGISIRTASLANLGNSLSFMFNPSNAAAPFPFLKFNSNGEVDGASTPNASTGPIEIKVFEGSVSAGADIATSRDRNLSETVSIARLTGRASQIP